MPKKVTLKHIGDSLGISVSAVSFAINNRPGIAEDLRVRVLETCEKMGYDLSRFDRKRAGAGEIGFLVRSEELENRESVYGLMVIEAQRVAEEHGYHLIPNGMCGDDVAAKKTPHFVERSIRGVILDEGFDAEYLHFLMRFRLPMVQMAHSELLPQINVVDADNEMGGEIAVKYLEERGHRRIGLIAGLPSHHSMLSRRAGYLLGMERSNLMLDHDIMVTNIDDNLPETAYAATREIMCRTATPPDAFFCVSDPYATGCIRALQDLGFSVPADISVIGFDNHSYAQHLNPPLTTVELPILNIAKVAVQRLVNLIQLRDQNFPDVIGKFLVPVRIIERASVANRKPSEPRRRNGQPARRPANHAKAVAKQV